MARKRTKVKIPEGIVDYYVIYSIDRRTATKDIRKILLQRQGEIRSNMANASLGSNEILEKLQEAYNTIADAVKTFKNDERRKEYDAALDAAYNAGKIDVAAQSMAQDLYEELEALFLKGDYKGVIRKCLNALDKNVRDYRIYILLARSYFTLQEIERSLQSVEDGLSVHPNNVELLRTGARFSNDGKHDFDKAQNYINRIAEVEPNSPIYASEQSYLYLTSGKEDLAYKMIDEYVAKHPNDQEFRRNCAYDLIGYSYSYYTKEPNGEAYIIASEEDYQKCLDTCNKAASIYNDENVRAALENANYYGQTEFNDENKESIFWLRIGTILYLFPVIGYACIGISDMGFPQGLLYMVYLLPMLVLGIGCFYCAKRLKELSYRPYWQINKFILTGKREKIEGRYIFIGKIFTGYMKICFKITWWIVKLVFRLV